MSFGMSEKVGILRLTARARGKKNSKLSLEGNREEKRQGTGRDAQKGRIGCNLEEHMGKLRPALQICLEDECGNL
jgi:hypothetical protein